MKQVAFIAFAALLVMIPASAQNTPEKNARNQPELMTVVGCLSKSGNTYVITGGAPGAQEFRIIAGDTSMLKGQQGQSVEIVGMVTQSNPAKDAAPPYHAGSTTGVGYETIELQKAKVLGGMCSNPGQEWKGDHMK